MTPVPAPQVPPIRTPFSEQVSLVPPVIPFTATREYWLYLSQMNAFVRSMNNELDALSDHVDDLVRSGTHAGRLAVDPVTAPPAALWSETDRSGVFYQVQPGAGGVPAWQYIAGTMFGTLSPDDRPTDLGPRDAGFDFRTTDTNTDYAPREFLWSGAEWVEVTQVLYGTHSARPPANSSTPARTLYVETDRGNVIYQNQGNQWLYVAGTMAGTTAAKPAGLGANDTGFRYWATDGPELRWSGSAWVPGSGQTPWLSDIDGAGHALTNVSQIGVGTSAPQATIDARNPSGFYAGFFGGSTPGIVALGSFGSVPFIQGYTSQIGTIASNLILQVSGGNVAIGNITPTAQLQLSLDSAAKPATNTWTVVSDGRTKRNVKRFEGDMELIRRLDPIEAEYNGKGGTPEGRRVVSFDAAELHEILPHAVSSVRAKLHPEDQEETDLLGVNTHEIFYHMLRAIQQLDTELQELKRRP